MSARDAQLAIDRARYWAVCEQPFYSALAQQLVDVIDPNVETAQTDGKVIRWNPAFVEPLSDAELRFVLLHETLHCAHLHMWRLPADKIGNDAGDYAINAILSKLDGIKMPEGGLLEARFSGVAEEEIDAELRKAQQPPEEPQDDAESEQDAQGDDQQQSGGGAGDEQSDDSAQDGAGDADSSEGDAEQQGSANDDGSASESAPQQGKGRPDSCGGFSAPAAAQDATSVQAAQQAQELRDQWERAVLQAAQVAQVLGRGDMPGDLIEQLKRVRAQQVDWRQETAEFIKDAQRSRNDWSRSARRHAWQPVIYPRKRADDVGLIVAGIDVSGSISLQAKEQFVALLQQCASETNATLCVCYIDRSICSEYRVEPGEEIPLDTQGGGGGTDFRPLFARADELQEQGERIAGVLYLTDLDGPEPDETRHPTLWLCTTDVHAKTGRTVKIEEGAL